MYKSFDVCSICREDLLDYLTAEETKKIDDGQMQYIADKLGDALMDAYWLSLEVIIDDMYKDLIIK